MSALEYYRQQPLIARTVTAAVVVVSLAVHTRILPFTWINFAPSSLLRFPPQIWRLASSFCLTGSGLSVLFEAYFVFQYLSQLETGHPRLSRQADVVWYLIFVASIIILLCNSIFSFSYYLPALVLALTYTVSQDQPGQRVSFYIITVPAQFVPYLMILINVLMAPPMIPLQITGLLAAHLFDFLSRIYPEFGGGHNTIPTPAFLVNLLAPPPPLRGTGHGGRASGRPPTSVPLPDSWKVRGSGRRLGE